MVDALGVLAAETEADHLADVVEDRVETRRDVGAHHVGLGGEVAATDVEADAGNRNVTLIGDHPADRLGVAEVAVGAQHAGNGAADAHAPPHLSDGLVVVLAEDLQVAHDTSPIVRFGGGLNAERVARRSNGLSHSKNGTGGRTRTRVFGFGDRHSCR